jgi:energy-coupling factor transporter ATP-binding protein EcfA2
MNGQPVEQVLNFLPRFSGYVPQMDIVMESLTIEETLRNVAMLRMPDSVPTAVKHNHVHTVMEELGLLSVKDSIIKTRSGTSISGGERKRLCIGIELVSSPSILILDEPTTGLSATDALSVMTTVIELSRRRNITVVSSIHQPRKEIFLMFDRMLLLSMGRYLPFYLPSYCSPFFPIVLPSYLPSFLHFYLPSFVFFCPHFKFSLPPSFLPSFPPFLPSLPSFPPFLPSFLPVCLSAFLPSCLPGRFSSAPATTAARIFPKWASPVPTASTLLTGF